MIMIRMIKMINNNLLCELPVYISSDVRADIRPTNNTQLWSHIDKISFSPLIEREAYIQIFRIHLENF